MLRMTLLCLTISVVTIARKRNLREGEGKGLSAFRQHGLFLGRDHLVQGVRGESHQPTAGQEHSALRGVLQQLIQHKLHRDRSGYNGFRHAVCAG